MENGLTPPRQGKTVVSMVTHGQANRGLALSMLVVLVLATMSGLVQVPPSVVLEAAPEPATSVAGLENYRLYLTPRTAARAATVTSRPSSPLEVRKNSRR